MPPEGMPYPLLRERAEAACNTIDLLINHGADKGILIPSAADQDMAAQIVEAFAQDEAKASQKITTNRISSLPPAVLIEVKHMLDEFGQQVVQSAVHIRHLVTNKLILESGNPDAKVRIRALELLGKISDVGLFTERSEVVITDRSSDELKQTLRSKLDKLRAKRNADVIDVVPNVSNPDIADDQEQYIKTNSIVSINLDEELGLNTEGEKV